MNYSKGLFLSACVIAAASFGCSSKMAKSEKPIKPTTKTETASTKTVSSSEDSALHPEPVTIDAAAALNASAVAEISFKRNSAVLTNDARVSLDHVVSRAQDRGQVRDVKILAWADKDYPTKDAKRLPKRERDLAERRARAVKDYVATVFNLYKVDTYNMAKQPNTIARIFDTSDARVKQAIERAGIPHADSSAVASSKASRALVMVLINE